MRYTALKQWPAKTLFASCLETCQQHPAEPTPHFREALLFLLCVMYVQQLQQPPNPAEPMGIFGETLRNSPIDVQPPMDDVTLGH